MAPAPTPAVSIAWRANKEGTAPVDSVNSRGKVPNVVANITDQTLGAFQSDARTKKPGFY
jgi:hypothetical protein